MEDLEIKYKITRYTNIIKEIQNWNSTEFAERQQVLASLHEELEKEIAKEEKYQSTISKKLDEIAALKLMISERVSDTNGFSTKLPN
ncbi:hypothetical protein TVAG_120860 [Trichomonas vaginalis G3]|uniref:Uncharacterized protein n=1 Tax=Trichomonas vaginalis (strain ATCC PRA-98 / G3) TaxID=412133 RepID=A2D7N1_TRIV3|nr:hypothetical protein TVAGG3_0993990 [Trichomonas vaginalis G3]EAY23748.1 hypothetical protein TVAG_120860 [Trichomonas vaginalis G3]KAI5490243.1 hypothetical protein TVAGG3_0993990 [Trichomonas vaginalis G3]|eukprot:XP_001276996.1 hypothetical protein [Trichomonas vaginalis G3]